MQGTEKILVFCSREICYCSGNFFAHRLADAFEQLGFDTEVCEFTREDDFDAVLTPLFGKPYRAIFDFNSLLPRLAAEDGTPVLDLLDGPFYDYILDHPLFHYNCLVSGAKNFHAIVLDEGQAAYVRRFHSQLKTVHMLPLGAVEAVSSGRKGAARGVLFPGTYDSPDKVYEIVKASPEPIRSMIKSIIDQRLSEPNLPMEEAFSRYLESEGLSLPDSQFALMMNAMYPADAYIRDYFRTAALDALLRRGIPVTAVGTGWEKYRPCRSDCFVREKGVSFELSFERIAREQVLLDVSPIFNRGIHDRILAGMANRTAVLTDENPCRSARLSARRDVMFYSLKDLTTLADAAEELLTDSALLELIQEHAYETFRANHTWRSRAEEILSWQA